MDARLIDLTGRRFGRWVALRYLGGGQWDCLCDCGEHRVVHGPSLRRGLSTSCGCAIRERHTRNFAGEKFGRLTALHPTARRNGSRQIIWRFRCDCGTVIERPHQEVTRGNNTKSCGCSLREKETHCKYGHPRNELWHEERGCYKCILCRGRGLPFDTDEAILDALCLLNSTEREFGEDGRRKRRQ